MQTYKVALTPDGEYQQEIEASDPRFAAEEWAEWYCAHQSEYDLDECFVEQFPGAWRGFNITIESAPHYHATAAQPNTVKNSRS